MIILLKAIIAVSVMIGVPLMVMLVMVITSRKSNEYPPLDTTSG